MKNLMKKITGLVLAAAFLLPVATGCSELAGAGKTDSGKTASASSEQGYIVQGKVSLSGQPATSAASRSASTSLSSAALSGLTYRVSALSDDEKSIRLSGSFSESDMSYAVTLTNSGLWRITIEAQKDEETLLSGMKALEVTEDFLPIEEEILLYPVYSEGLSGAVALAISDSSGKIARVTYSGSGLVENSQGEIPELTGSALFSGGSATISETDVESGNYQVKLVFEDADGNVLYSCYEMVNVFAGFTTDSWLCSASSPSPYLISDAGGSFSFVLTDELIEGYGTETEKASGYVVYKAVAESDDTSLYRYYLTQSLDMEITDATDVTAQTESGYAPLNAFCFDGEGNFYAITKRLESATYITSSKDGFGSETAAANDGAMYLDGDLGNLIAADRKTNIVYTLAPSNKEVFKITGASYDESRTEYNPAATYQFGDDSNSSVINFADAFTVNNNIAYFVRYEYDDGAKIEVVIADLSAADPGTSEGYYSVSGSELHTVRLSSLDFWNEPEITDMLYQDGAVYILFREQNMSNDESRIISRGGLLRYDPLFGSTKVIGWTESTSTKNFTTGVRISSGIVYESYTNENDLSTGVPLLMDYSTGGGRDYEFYTPYGTLDSAFAGPQKFIAIKPKKLVISDSGTAFFTDDEGILKYKNVNRVVEVDLEKLAITDSTDIATEFATSYPVPGSTNFYGQGQDLSSYWTWSEVSNSFVTVSGAETPYGSFIKEE